MTREEASQLLAKTAEALGEHFDAVQILTSRMVSENGGTERFASGSGNWFARQGMAHAFIKSDEADTLAHEVGKKLAPPPDESETWKDGE
jgi:hypothetical protein